MRCLCLSWLGWKPMRANSRIASAKRMIPLTSPAKLLRTRYLKKKLSAVGMSRMPCAQSDKAPAATSMIFLNETRDIDDKRIAQKRLYCDDYRMVSPQGNGMSFNKPQKLSAALRRLADKNTNYVQV